MPRMLACCADGAAPASGGLQCIAGRLHQKWRHGARACRAPDRFSTHKLGCLESVICRGFSQSEVKKSNQGSGSNTIIKVMEGGVRADGANSGPHWDAAQ